MKVRTFSRSHSGPNMTPLVDVVMVILIFLMLAGSFGSAEHFLTYHAQGISSTIGTPGKALEPRITIFVRGGSGPLMATLDGHAVTDASDLRDRLADLRQKFQDNGVAPEKITVMLTPASGAEYQHVITAYQAAAGAKLTRVAFGK